MKIKPGHRLLGQTFDGKPIVAPKHSHSLTLAAAGSGKTTCCASVWLSCLAADPNHAMFVNDCKDGELAWQYASLLSRYGRKVAIIDDFNIMGNHPLKISLNPLSGINQAHKRNNGDYVFAVETACQSLIPTPKDQDLKNEFFRSQPRAIIEFVHASLASRNPKVATPGAIWSMVTDPITFEQIIQLEQAEGDDSLKALANHMQGMRDGDDHYNSHLSEVRKALRIYGANSLLHNAGRNAMLTHEQLLRDKYIVFVVGPVRHMERLGNHYALHLQSFIEAQLGGERFPCHYIIDEFTNAPLKGLVSQLTTIRGYSGHVHMLAQSRSEIERKCGEKEARTIAENAVTQQYLGFSSEKEAELISKMIGERVTVTGGISMESNKLSYGQDYKLGKERHYSLERLLSLPNDEQIIFIKDIG